jgi:hypothetical protein
MEVMSQLHPLGKNSRYPMDVRLGRTLAGLDMMNKRKISVPLPGAGRRYTGFLTLHLDTVMANPRRLFLESEWNLHSSLKF